MAQGISRAHEKWAWTEETALELVRLWNLGESGSVIAQKLFCSRSAVMGKVHRLRAAGVHMRDAKPETRIGSLGNFIVSRARPARRKPTSVSPISIRESRPNNQPPGRFIVDKSFDEENPLTKGGKKLLELLSEKMPGTGIGVMALGRRQCRNPTGGTAPQWLFCGNPIVDGVASSYCMTCRPRMWVRQTA